jgi:alpha-methylacyl-CoA racemase
MMLADLGASVLRVARPSKLPREPNPVLDRGRAGRVTLDLKSEEGRVRFLDLVAQADGLIEGYRPGVMERLGLGPEPCKGRNPRLVYGRVTGWGRSGPLAHTAGHDINYIALSGALHACGTAQSGPVVPLNLVGDFGGGGLMLAFGMVCAILESRSSGQGQVVDAAMVDGAAALMAMMYGMRATGRWPAARAGNLLDGSAFYYTCYACADGEWISVGALEEEFRRILFEKLGLASEADQLLRVPPNDSAMRQRFAEIFRTRSRAQWQQIFEGSDACVAPVLAMNEVLEHPHNEIWGSYRRIDGDIHPMPAPRFSRTPAAVPERAQFQAPEPGSGWVLDVD